MKGKPALFGLRLLRTQSIKPLSLWLSAAAMCLISWQIISFKGDALLRHSQHPLSPPSSKPVSSSKLRIFTPDWGIAAELNALGHPPIATGDARMYAQWMGQRLPDNTCDVGIRYQPNPELMAQLDIDMVIDNFFYEHIRPMYGDVAVESLLFKSSNEKAVWQDYVDLTKQLGKIIRDSKAATEYIKISEDQLIQSGDEFRGKHPNISKLAIVQFADVGNLRMYAHNSVYQPALHKMGLELAVFGHGNEWGYVPIQLAQLSQLDQQTCLIVVKPFSDMLQTELNGSLLWQTMGFGGHRCMAVIDPVWMYGGIASMLEFSVSLLKADISS